MTTSFTLQLLNEEVVLPDLTIDQAMDIAQIPQAFNEKRLSAMIGHLSGDNSLAGRLTAQERYYFLLSHQIAMESNYSQEVGNSDYLVYTVQNEVPNTAVVGDVVVGHLYGSHACVLEGICENVYDWTRGQMACQLSGDLAFFIGGDDEAYKWEPLDPALKDNELNEIIQTRVKLIGSLSPKRFNDLEEGFTNGINQLAHFVVLGQDNAGITIIKQGGEGAGEPSRFLPLDTLEGAAYQIAECLA